MFRYELKKIFGKKKLVILGAFYILLMFYCLFLMVGSKELPRDGGEVLLQFTGGFDYFILVNVCIVIVTVAALFPLERETGLSQVLLASKYGKNRLATVKIGAALFLANAFFAVIVLVLILGYVAVFGRDFSFDEFYCAFHDVFVNKISEGAIGGGQRDFPVFCRHFSAGDTGAWLCVQSVACLPWHEGGDIQGFIFNRFSFCDGASCGNGGLSFADWGVICQGEICI